MPKVLMRRSAPTTSNLGIKGLQKLLDQEKRSCPRFSHYWLNLIPPAKVRLVEEYALGSSRVRIYACRGELDLLYQITPWEYTIPLVEMEMLASTADWVRASSPPEAILEGDELRHWVSSMAITRLRRLTKEGRAMPGLDPMALEVRLQSLAEVVARYTAGLGLFEILLSDRRLEDIYVDAPCRQNPLHISIAGLAGHNSLARCATNIIADETEMKALIARLKLGSGRSFSEASPILECDVQGRDARATVVGPPLSPNGIALALRRHASEPWTLMRMVHAGTMDCFTAALISFLVDGRSTILVCGPRGAGKSSALGAMLFEFPPGQRILTIEDTPELPVRTMQSMGYKVQSLLIEKRAGENEGERAEEALRVSLRMGESAIILGEVRGREAQVLYESMRTGKAGSSVMGTIHGEGARSVFERVVHDMHIDPEAFMATDAILTLGLVRPRGSQRPLRRLVELVEVKRPTCSFHPLIDQESEACKEDLVKTSQLFAKIARSWGMSEEEALCNIQARADIREILLQSAQKRGVEYLSPYWTSRANSFLWERMEGGEADYEGIVEGFRTLLNKGQGGSL
jgi:archaeal flagellar protein FlaI